MFKGTEKGTVRLEQSIFNDRRAVNRNYLLELDSACLLQNFYLEAGIIMPGLQVIDDPAGAKLHWGWEAPTCQLRGHFLGHFMSAAAHLISEGQDRALEAKLLDIVDELAKCQKLNGGRWIGSIPEKYFKKLHTGDYIWSPQYTLHKTIMGLTDTYRFTGYAPALEILNNLADWYIDWAEEMTGAGDPWAVLRGEAGGMLEAWATLYKLTGDERYERLAGYYSGYGMLEDTLAGRDPLSNSHANASIPQAQGAAAMYEITGDETWKQKAIAFFDSAVHKRGSFATGGQNAGEFWIPPRMLGQFTGDRDQEFCTVYNMVRLADYLFKFTGDKEYLDYIEKNLYNGFLAQQNKNTGMPTYFLPMRAGGSKKWGTKRNDFWCCHGTMVQAQTIYPELCYYEGENETVIAQYIPSTYRTEGLTITQGSAMKYYNDAALFDETDDSQMSRWFLKFNITSDSEKTILFRVPEWVTGDVIITENGAFVETPVKDGFISLTRKWNGETLQMYLPAGLHFERLEGRENMFAALDGPICLAAVVNNDEGVMIHDPEHAFVPHLEHTYESYPWLQTNYRAAGQGKETEFKPLYDITDEKYTIYLTEV